jgi:hypothetical protein
VLADTRQTVIYVIQMNLALQVVRSLLSQNLHMKTVHRASPLPFSSCLPVCLKGMDMISVPESHGRHTARCAEGINGLTNEYQGFVLHTRTKYLDSCTFWHWSHNDNPVSVGLPWISRGCSNLSLFLSCLFLLSVYLYSLFIFQASCLIYFFIPSPSLFVLSLFFFFFLPFFYFCLFHLFPLLFPYSI